MKRYGNDPASYSVVTIAFPQSVISILTICTEIERGTARRGANSSGDKVGKVGSAGNHIALVGVSRFSKKEKSWHECH